jgi:hypothetical protein
VSETTYSAGAAFCGWYFRPAPCSLHIMGIHSKDYRVREGSEVDLDQWPTRTARVYEDDADYQSILGEHVKKLSALQELLYASGRYAVLLIFQGDCARHVRGQPAGMPGVQLQATERHRAQA